MTPLHTTVMLSNCALVNNEGLGGGRPRAPTVVTSLYVRRLLSRGEARKRGTRHFCCRTRACTVLSHFSSRVSLVVHACTVLSHFSSRVSLVVQNTRALRGGPAACDVKCCSSIRNLACCRKN